MRDDRRDERIDNTRRYTEDRYDRDDFDDRYDRDDFDDRYDRDDMYARDDCDEMYARDDREDRYARDDREDRYARDDREDRYARDDREDRYTRGGRNARSRRYDERDGRDVRERRRRYDDYDEDFDDRRGIKKHGNGILTALIVAAVLLIGAVIFVKIAIPSIKHKTKQAVAEKAVETVFENADKIPGAGEKIGEITSKMSEEDKEKVTEIVAEHMDTETVSDVMEYVNNGDEAGLIEYASKELSPEEVQELTELYQKYKD